MDQKTAYNIFSLDTSITEKYETVEMMWFDGFDGQEGRYVCVSSRGVDSGVRPIDCRYCLQRHADALTK
jgi:hypothetical protein